MWLAMQCRSSEMPAASGPGLDLSQFWFQLSYKYAKISFFEKKLLDADVRKH